MFQIKTTMMVKKEENTQEPGQEAKPKEMANEHEIKEVGKGIPRPRVHIVSRKKCLDKEDS